MDFTLKTYQSLLNNFLQKQYQFITFHEYIVYSLKIENSTTKQLKNSTFLPLNFSTSKLYNSSISKFIILRHDVDRLPQNALTLAKIENSFGIKGTYYFRIVPESIDLKAMQQIAGLGHEIGYHYEDVDLVLKRWSSEVRKTGFGIKRSEGSSRKTEIGWWNGKIDENKLIDAAYESFCKNLEIFRKYFDIKTICMHGSPHSKYDNKIIWKKYNYKELGLLGEPYFDIDFKEFAYFTDTGRRWNGKNVSIRDKVDSKYNFSFRSTLSIIKNIEKLPSKIMFTVHPERWHYKPLPWLKELILQNVKNIVKYSYVNFK